MLKKKIKSKALIAACLALLLLLIIFFTGFPFLIERYYTEWFYQLSGYPLHFIFNIFPFSVGDIFYVAVVAYFIYGLIVFLRNLVKGLYSKCGMALINLLITIETAVVIFYLFWGLNYYRPSAAKLLKLDVRDFTTAELVKVTTFLIDSANNLRARVTAKDFKQSNDSIYRTAVRSINKLHSSYTILRIYKPAVKPSLLSTLLNYMGTSGYYNPFTGEAQINYGIPLFNRPVTACHEIAHQLGFAAEDEANFVGFLACAGSGNNFFKYSAYQLAVGEFMHTLYLRDSTANKNLRLKISPAVHLDFKYERTYWQYYENRAGAITGIFYDNFLKANNQPKGLNTYNDMVLLIMALYDKNHSAYN